MELRQLRAFAAVAHTRHFRKAAEELTLAQPALTRAVQQLERELGVRLFDRTTRQVRLTSAGQAFLVRIEQLLSSLEQATSELQDGAHLGQADSRVTLGVGIAVRLAALHMPQMLYSFHGQHAGIQTRVRVAETGQLVRQLQQGAIDVALMDMAAADPVDVSDLQFRRLFADELVLLTPPGHMLAGRENLDLKLLEGQKLVWFSAGPAIRQTLLEATCRQAGVVPILAFDADESHTLREMVALKIGLALAPPWVAASDGPAVQALNTSPRLSWDLRLAWTERSRRRPPVNALLEFLWEPLHAVCQAPTS